MSLTIALAGNPNSGKTTLFNILTGSNQYVGNWPGVTVEKKEGRLKSNKDIIIADLPGIYSLSPYTLEEVVARNYLIKEKPDAIINIVDGTNLERNLYLTTQLTELGIPVVMAINMTDIVRKNGDEININALSDKMGCPVFEISALKNTGIDEVTKKATELARAGSGQKPRHKFSSKAEGYLAQIEAMLDGVDKDKKRFAAIKLFERDDKISEIIKTVPNCEDIIEKAEKDFDDDSESIITNERYTYITSIMGDCLKKANAGKPTTSDKIDSIVTNRILALPIFVVVMFLVYYISVTTVGTLVTDWTNDGLFGDGWHLFGMGTQEYDEATTQYAIDNIWSNRDLVKTVEDAVNANVIGAEDILASINDSDFGAFDEAYTSYADSLAENGFAINDYVDEQLENLPDPADYGTWVPGIPVLVESLLEKINCAEWLSGLILDGIVSGVGAVLGFVPQMFVLFILLALLEECGYMARIAFIMDRVFRKFGLSGKSFIPILIGTGCGVPGIMASRTIENDRDRKMTIITTTFIPCGAKLPIIALVTAALFGGAWWVAPSAYFMGIIAIITSGIILKKTKIFAGDVSPFVMELPAYHAPTFGNVIHSMWERGYSFIKKAGTVILLSSILIWAGSHFGNTGSGFGFSTEMELGSSVLGMIGNAVRYIFIPLGFGAGETGATATISTVMGLVAKEEVVAVFGVLDFEGLGRLAGYSFLTFNLLCAPCFAAISAIRREMNNAKWLWFAIGYQTGFAYFVSLCIYQIGMIVSGSFGLGSAAAIVLIAIFIYLLFRPNKAAARLKAAAQS